MSEEDDEDEQDQPQVIEKKGDEVSNDLDFYAWDSHKKRRIHWIFQDYEIRTTPYSRSSSKPPMNNVSSIEWNTISASHLLFKYMHEWKL